MNLYFFYLSESPPLIHIRSSVIDEMQSYTDGWTG